MDYTTPLGYLLIHITIGYIAFFYPLLWIPIVLYNIAQLVLDGRFFIHEMRMAPGNSTLYTAYKLAQYALGWGIAVIVASVSSD